MLILLVEPSGRRLFGIQWLVGFLTFLLPFASQKFREFVRPIHHYFGAMLFIFSIATAYTGMSQLLVHHLGASYMHFPPEGVFANCLTLFMGLIVFFGIFLVANIDFRRLPAYVDEMR